MNLPAISQDALTAALAPLHAHTIECAMSDFGSLARGKLVSMSDFKSAGGCKLPTVLLGMGVTGGAPQRCLAPCSPRATAT